MEGDAGSSQLNPTDADETPLASPETDTQETTEQTSTEQPDNTADDRRPTRIGRGIAVAVCAGPLYALSQRTAADLIEPTAYIDTVLGR